MKTCNRRGLFGMFGGVAAAVLGAPRAEAEYLLDTKGNLTFGYTAYATNGFVVGESLKQVCEHEPLVKTERSTGSTLIRCESSALEEGKVYIADFHFCRKCGELYTECYQSDPEPLPELPPGCSYHTPKGIVEIGNNGRWQS